MPDTSTGPNIVIFDQFSLDLDTGELFRNQQAVPLQGRPFQVLSALLESPGELVTRQELYERMWAGIAADYRCGLDTAVRKLRRALGDRSSCIETLPRRGYRLKRAVEVRTCQPGATGNGAMSLAEGAGFPVRTAGS